MSWISLEASPNRLSKLRKASTIVGLWSTGEWRGDQIKAEAEYRIGGVDRQTPSTDLSWGWAVATHLPIDTELLRVLCYLRQVLKEVLQG